MNLPSFLLVGPFKTEVTTLCSTLAKHPRLQPRDVLEQEDPPHFFGDTFEDWNLEKYSQSFPEVNAGTKTFETNSSYFACAKTRARIKLLLAEVKIVVVLQDPVTRALASISLNKTASLIDTDPRSIDTIFNDFIERGYEQKPFNYFSEGEYVCHLKCWHNCFPRDQIKVIFYEELLEDPEAELAKLYEFVGVSPLSERLAFNDSREQSGGAFSFRGEQIKSLRAYYEPFDSALAEYLNRPLPWQTRPSKVENSSATLAASTKHMRPSFLLVGPGKTGTTSMWNMLRQHPDVLTVPQKEVHFFGCEENFTNGFDSYLELFPLVQDSYGKVAFEASPGYFTLPKEHMLRIKECLPQVKIVCTLRDPVERFFSFFRHFHTLHRVATEPALFERMCQLWAERSLPSPDISGPRVNMTLDEIFALLYRGQHDPFGMLFGGLYLPRIKEWLEVFDEYHVFPFVIEDLQHSEFDSYGFLLEFLGLSPQETKRLHHNKAENYIDVFEDKSIFEPTAEQRTWLEDFYRPHNKALFEFLGRPAAW